MLIVDGKVILLPVEQFNVITVVTWVARKPRGNEHPLLYNVLPF
jgi:hypothetical protein